MSDNLIIVLTGLILLVLFCVAYAIYTALYSDNKIPNQSQSNSKTFKSKETLDLSQVTNKIEKIENLLNIKHSVQSSNISNLVTRLDKVYLNLEVLVRDLDLKANQSSMINNNPSNDFKPVENYKYKTKIESKSVERGFSDQFVDATTSILQTYNQAVIDRSSRPKFWNQYSYVTLGNVNAVEQRLGTANKPEFREVPNGDFIAIRVREEKYFIFLQFDMTLTPQRFKEGGINFVFELSGYDGNSSYSNIEIKSPAIFERFGSEWKLIRKGAILL